MLAIALSNLPIGEASGGYPKSCPVHHLRLRREKLGIIYGLVADPCAGSERIASAAKNFPYANSVIYGGCVIEPSSPKYKEVLYCERCREVEKSWPCLETQPLPVIKKLSWFLAQRRYNNGMHPTADTMALM
jgi:hypothetical protein